MLSVGVREEERENRAKRAQAREQRQASEISDVTYNDKRARERSGHSATRHSALRLVPHMCHVTPANNTVSRAGAGVMYTAPHAPAPGPAKENGRNGYARTATQCRRPKPTPAARPNARGPPRAATRWIGCPHAPAAQSRPRRRTFRAAPPTA